MRSKFTVTKANEVEHRGVCPRTGLPFVRRYWVPAQGGYVYVDDTIDGTRPGTLGRQPHVNGMTWRSSPEYLLTLVKAEWRQTQRWARR